MKKTAGILFLALTVMFTGCKKKEKKMAPKPTKVKMVKTVNVNLESKSDSNVTGDIVFTEENSTVKMVAHLQGLEPGTHAIHIHQKADCSSPDGKSSGGHWNPTAQPHGKWGAATGYHKGDIGNIVANEKGMAVKTFSTNEWCIDCDDVNKNIVGKAVIVHKGEDDYGQPTGNAGGRVSCGGIIQ